MKKLDFIGEANEVFLPLTSATTYEKPAPPSMMNLISWNCSGLGNPWMVCEVCDLAGQEASKILFLCETKCNSRVVDQLKSKINFLVFLLIPAAILVVQPSFGRKILMSLP